MSYFAPSAFSAPPGGNIGQPGPVAPQGPDDCGRCCQMGHHRHQCPDTMHRTPGTSCPHPRGMRADASTIGPGSSVSAFGTPQTQFSSLDAIFGTPVSGGSPMSSIMATLRQNFPHLDNATLQELANEGNRSRAADDATRAIAMLQAAGRSIPPSLQALAAAGAPPPTLAAPQVTPTGGPPPGPTPPAVPTPNRPLTNRIVLQGAQAGTTGVTRSGSWQATLANVNALAPGLAATQATLRSVSFAYSSANIANLNHQMVVGIYRGTPQPNNTTMLAAANNALAVSAPFTPGSSGTVTITAPADLNITAATNDLWVQAYFVGNGTASTNNAVTFTATVGVDIN